CQASRSRPSAGCSESWATSSPRSPTASQSSSTWA
ncbi:MAG: hypothetical protein AVDCRST_MAG76-1405, partial [uncultured Acidimicrobiales bacterium]